MSALYSEIRDTIKTGDLIAWEKRRLGGFIDLLLFLYQKIFKAKFTHVGVAISIGKRVLIVEATPPVVRIYPLSMMSDFYLLRTNTRYRVRHLDILFNSVGKKYSLTDFIRNLLKVENKSTSYYCSELAAEFYKEIGLIDNVNSGLTPDTIVDEIKKVTGNEPLFVQIDRGNL